MTDSSTPATDHHVADAHVRAAALGSAAPTDVSPVRRFEPGISRAQVRRHVVAPAVLAGGYFVAGKLGLLLGLVHPSASAVWAPTGIALAALLLLGFRAWPGIFA